MKLWLAKLRISAALDSQRPRSRSLERKFSTSHELRRFVKRNAQVEQVLRRERPDYETPSGLHSSIMTAVRKASRPAASSRVRWARWVPATALAMLLVAGLWWATRSQPSAQALVPVSNALAISQQMAQTMPQEVVAPLSDEWQRLTNDLDATARFLQASVP
jgi:hypothetical protein